MRTVKYVFERLESVIRHECLGEIHENLRRTKDKEQNKAIWKRNRLVKYMQYV